MRCRACTASCYQMAVTAIVAGERYSLVCFCWACSVHVLAPICQTAFVAPRPHERELSGHERSTCAAVHALPAATRWQSQLASLASATHLFARARALGSTPAQAAARSSYRSAAKAPLRGPQSSCTSLPVWIHLAATVVESLSKARALRTKPCQRAAEGPSSSAWTRPVSYTHLTLPTILLV